MSPRGQQNSHQQPHRFIKEKPTVVRSFIYSLPSPLSQYLEGCFNSSGFRTGSCATFYHFPIYSKSYYYQSPLPTPKAFWSFIIRAICSLITKITQDIWCQKIKGTTFTFKVASSFSFTIKEPGDAGWLFLCTLARQTLATHYKQYTTSSLPWSSSYSVLYFWSWNIPALFLQLR